MTEEDSGPGVKTSLFEAWRRLLGGEQVAMRSAASTSFETTVEKILQTYGKAILGRLHYLNLEELIVRRGGGQKTRLKKVENIFLSVIGRNLKEGETYVRPDVSTVFFLFPGLTRKAGELKCAVIADQIARALVEEDPVFADLKSERTIQDIDQRKWNALRGAPRALASLPGNARKARGSAAPTSMKAENPKQPSFKKPGAALQRDVPLSPSAVYADRQLEGIRVAYQAIWNVRSKMITSYAAIPHRRHSDGTTAKGKWVIGSDAGFAMIAALDLFVLRESVAWLHGLINVRQQTLLVLPVHFTTIESQPLFLPYRRELTALSQDERKYIVIEILGVPDRLPAFRIKELVARLRPLARCILVQLPPDSVHIGHWAEGGILGVGFTIGDGKVSEKLLMEKMDTLVASAEKAGVHAYIHDLATMSLATAAVASGFRYVGGEAILPESEVPNPIEPFECQSIFARVIGA